jgi:hypothetical protein
MLDMEIAIHQGKKVMLAEYLSNEILSTVEDIVDLLGNASYRGATSIIVNQNRFESSFFDLKTGIAGDILQKFSNYQCRLAIIGDFSDIESKSMRDFIRESNRHGRIIFVESKEEAMELLGGS